MLFGKNKTENEAAKHSPIEGQFLPTAHRHLVRYFAHCALGDAGNAPEEAIDAFFEDIDKQRREKANSGDDIPLLDESVLNRETIDGLVQKAIKKLEPKGP